MKNNYLSEVELYFWPNRRIENQIGIYILCSFTTISKLYGEDELGILYVGKTINSFANRHNLKKFQKKSYHKKTQYGFDHSSLYWVLDFDISKDQECEFARKIKDKSEESDQYFRDILIHDCINKLNAPTFTGNKAFLIMIPLDYLKNKIPDYKREISSLEKSILSGHLLKYGVLPPYNATGSSYNSVYGRNNENERQKLKETFSHIEDKLLAKKDIKQSC
ncbi:hypothetical protein [Halobacteriovorax sp. HLS]|uniref:hypothetical protein n=1 Tax=Halobacteriovorax sp. HLS TaxID=2234000 RepID=UPI000FD7CACA|nr:hypothetical protein [Halobacteriovorax sp. HLS]